ELPSRAAVRSGTRLAPAPCMTRRSSDMRSALTLQTVTLAGLGVLVGGCVRASAEQLRTRAAYDLHCDVASLRVVELDERTRGVTGCDQQATYVESCDGPKGNASTNCTWILNSDGAVEKVTASPQRAPAAAPRCVPGSTQACLGPGACK